MLRRVMVVLPFLLIALVVVNGLLANNDARETGLWGSPQETEPVFRGQVLGGLKTLDPSAVDSLAERQVASAVFEGLLYLNQDGEPLPLLAEKWEEISPGVYRFHLRKDVKFHNGELLTAAQVKASWERSARRANNPGSRSFLDPILGAKEFGEGKAQDITGLRAPEDTVLEVQLTAPLPDYLRRLAVPAAWVVNVSETLSQGAAFGQGGTYAQPNSTLSGTGPYKLMEWVDGQFLTLGRFEKYHGEKPSLSRIQIALSGDRETALVDFTTGKLDWLQLNGEAQAQARDGSRPGLSPHISPAWEWVYLGVTFNEPLLQNGEVRRLVRQALDRDDLSQVSPLPAQGLQSLTPPQVAAAGREILPEGLPHARQSLKQFLAQAGGQSLEEFKSVTWSLAYPQDRGWEGVAQQVKEQLKPSGINLELKPLPASSYGYWLSQSSAGFFLYPWRGTYPRLENFLLNFHTLYAGQSGLAPYGSDYLNTLIEGAQAGNKSQAREALSLLESQGMLIPLLHLQYGSLVADRVGGFAYRWDGLIPWAELTLAP